MAVSKMEAVPPFQRPPPAPTPALLPSPGGAALRLVVADGTSLDREDRRGAEVRRVGGCRPVVEAAAEAAAAVAAVPPSPPCAWLWVSVLPEMVRTPPRRFATPPPRRSAAAAADGLVMRHRAIPERDRAAPGNGDKRVAAVIREPATDARVHEGAGRVAVAADGAVVAERHVAEGQAHGLTRCIPCRSGDSPRRCPCRRTGSWCRPPGCRCPRGPRCPRRGYR